MQIVLSGASCVSQTIDVRLSTDRRTAGRQEAAGQIQQVGRFSICVAQVRQARHSWRTLLAESSRVIVSSTGTGKSAKHTTMASLSIDLTVATDQLHPPEETRSIVSERAGTAKQTFRAGSKAV